ncbi:MAG: non-ribosomal peptide synthetase, partial [Gammaproteobacteria bacterium]
SPALTEPAWSVAPSVWSAFAAVAAAAPKQLAISSATTRWSYGALVEYSSRVAHGCVEAGVESGDRVGLLAGHDAAAIAGLLGILQAGGAYVVLDPGEPVSRQQAMLSDAGVRVLVSDGPRATAAQSLGLPVVRVDTQADGRQTAPVGRSVSGSELAYVLYTSGTTGKPKGVMQSQSGLLAQVGRYAASLELTAADRLSLLSGLGYDAAVQDVFGALLSGASLHLLDLRDGRGAGAQVEELGEAGVTVVHATPTVYRHLFGGELDCRHGLGAVRRVVLGGEVARRGDLALFRSRFASAVLVNGYGLTECTVGLQWQATAQTAVAGDDLPLGQPVGEVAVRLMSAQGQESWLGEIQLAGPGLSLGYWADEALTAARFVADESAPGGRWYRTGDRGWRRPDGTLGYLGRQDDQVKLRGRRLELGEVESVLLAYPGLSAVAAGVVRGAAGDDQLVAWTAGTEVEPQALRAWCRARLPDWAVPGAWVSLPSLPRLANGKVARAQLPAPSRQAGPERAVRPGLEADLAQLWAQLLGLEAVAPHEDFFALGGHSLLATRLVARIREQFGREIPLALIFSKPQLADFAASVGRISSPSVLPPIPRLPRRGQDKAG